MTEPVLPDAVRDFLRSVGSAGTPAAEKFPVSAKMRREAEARRAAAEDARQKAEAEFGARLNGEETPVELVGRMIAGQGIYLGRYEPVDPIGNSLGRTFNIFAAPHDLKEIYSYEDTVKHLAALKDWNGFDGTPYKDDKELKIALEDRRYTGGWIIPPIHVLAMLNDQRDKEDFRRTFVVTAMTGDAFNDPSWYWSSTTDMDQVKCMRSIQFKYGVTDRCRAHGARRSVRPVRLTPVKPGGRA